MNMKQLRYVAVLSQYNNFTRAADELGISQPSLSQYIKNIEKQLGIDLFIRNGQDVRITDAGETYLQLGLKILNLENEMNNRINDIKNEKKGTIRIGIASYRCSTLLPNVIKKFHEFYPNIKIIISEQKTTDLKESAEHGIIDLCVSTLPIDEGKFYFNEIMNDINLLAIPKKMCEDYGIFKKSYQTISIVDCKDMPFISLSQSQLQGQMLNELCEKNDININIVTECYNIISAHSLANGGIGAALLPQSLVKENENNNLNYYYLKEKSPEKKIVIFYRKELYLSKAMKKLIEIFIDIKQER